MLEALLVSNVVLWVLVVVLTITVLALARQVGVLHERIAPAGALTPTSGPKVGEVVGAAAYPTLDGSEVTVGGSTAGRLMLVLFVSPTCPVCRGLVPVARRLSHAEDLDLVFASDGDSRLAHEQYVLALDIAAFPYVLSQTLGMGFGVSKLPFAVLIDPQGVLVAKGLVNTREHLESLIEARERGVATLQDYLQDSMPDAFQPLQQETAQQETAQQKPGGA